MRRSAGRTAAWMLVGVAATLVRAETTAVGPPHTRRTRGPAVRVAAADRPAPARPPVHVFGGSDVKVRVGAGGEPVPWWLVHERLVLARGTVRPGPDATARVRLGLPAVRHRTPCRLVCRAGGRWTVAPLHVWPASLLAPARRRVAALSPAAFDPSGRVQAALTAEGLAAGPFETAIQRMAFDGDLVVLALGDGATLARGDWTRLEAQVRDGLTVLVLNPPPAWRRWGLRAVALDAPLGESVRLGRDFGQVLRPGDLGSGPWEFGLRADVPVIRLAWTAPAAEAAPAGPARPGCLLVAARVLGDGAVVAAAVPRLGRPREDPVGRAVLAELLLWVARRQKPPRPGVIREGTIETRVEGGVP
ncbi:MAG: hypothetical protein R6X20_06645 [Phycisphaerae bacterium]